MGYSVCTTWLKLLLHQPNTNCDQFLIVVLDIQYTLMWKINLRIKHRQRWIIVKDTRRSNQEIIIQRHWQQWPQGTEERQSNQKHTLKHIQSSNSLRWDVFGHISTLTPSLLKCMYLDQRGACNILYVRGNDSTSVFTISAYNLELLCQLSVF